MLVAVVGDGDASDAAAAVATDGCGSDLCRPFGTWRRSAWYFLQAGLSIFPAVIDSSGTDAPSSRS